ncbi:MAG: dihydroorotase [Candidatus Goldbacteria bacterium]|nr:dihydroorotase [Candidatus Goldiibacteriota bacterium]
MKTLLIKNGLVIDPANNIEEKLDVLITDGKIEKVTKNISDKETKIIDAEGLVVMPGFIDMHVHFREPGFEYKETIESGSRAAVKGGYTTVCCMPNTLPPIDNQAMVEFINLKSKQVGLIDVLPIGTITKERKGEELAPIGELFKAGAVAISDDGSCVANSEIIRRALEYCKMFGIPVIEHCEDTNLSTDGLMNEGYYSTLLGLKGIPKAAEEVIVARDIIIAGEVGGKLHIAHVSTEGSVELLTWAKKKGINVTAEVTPHHFTLDESMLINYNTNYKMNPPLRTKKDIKALKDALKNDVIDVIATDHAPHAELDKDVEFSAAAFGIIGLETAFPLIITELVSTGILSLSSAISKITINPAKILNLKKGTLAIGADADITIADINKEIEITEDFFGSRSSNSPFIGKKMKGSIEMVIKNGKIIYDKGVLK